MTKLLASPSPLLPSGSFAHLERFLRSPRAVPPLTRDYQREMISTIDVSRSTLVVPMSNDI